MLTSKEVELIEEIERVAADLGHSPTIAEFQEADTKVSYDQIRRYIGSWNMAKWVAGLEQYNGRPFGLQNDGKYAYFDEAMEASVCKRCGTDSDILFHHPDGVEKVANVSDMRMDNRFSKQDMVDEVEKCVPLCRGCHNKVHAES